MKSFSKLLWSLVIAGGLVMVTSCGGGEGETKGADSTKTDTTAKVQAEPEKPAAPQYWALEAATEEEKLGEKMCNCLVETYTALGIDMTQLTSIDKAQFEQDMKNIKSEKELLEKYPIFAQIKEKVKSAGDPPACGKEISQEMNEKKLNRAKVMEALNKGCALPMPQ